MRRIRNLGAVVSLVALALAFPGPGADAAGTPPGVYTLFAKSFTSHWYGFVTLPVDAWAPLARGSINNLPFADADARLVDPGLLVGSVGNDAMKSYTCNDQYAADYDAPPEFPIEKLDVPDEACQRTLFPSARSEFPTPDPTLAGQQDSGVAFDAVDGQRIGRITALTECLDPECAAGEGRVHSHSEVGAGVAGLTNYVRIGAAYAFSDLTTDAKGILVGVTYSELTDLVIGPPEAQVRIDSLRTEIRVKGHESKESKTVEGFSRITGMTIMGTPVEVTREGLRVADPALPSAMAFDQAQALLDALAGAGVVIEVPDHQAVTVSESVRKIEAQAQGISVRFLTNLEPVDLPEGDLPVVEGPEAELPVAGTVKPKVGGHVGGPTAPPPHEQRVDLGYSIASLTASKGAASGFINPGGPLGRPGSLLGGSVTEVLGETTEFDGEGLTALAGGGGLGTPADEALAGSPGAGSEVQPSIFSPLSSKVAERLDWVMLGLLLAGLVLPATRFAVQRLSSSER